VLLFVYDYVFELDIPVSYMSLVEVLQGLQELLDDTLGLLLLELAVGRRFEVSMQTLTASVLHH